MPKGIGYSQSPSSKSFWDKHTVKPKAQEPPKKPQTNSKAMRRQQNIRKRGPSY